MARKKNNETTEATETTETKQPSLVTRAKYAVAEVYKQLEAFAEGAKINIADMFSDAGTFEEFQSIAEAILENSQRGLSPELKLEQVNEEINAHWALGQTDINVIQTDEWNAKATKLLTRKNNILRQIKAKNSEDETEDTADESAEAVTA